MLGLRLQILFVIFLAISLLNPSSAPRSARADTSQGSWSPTINYPSNISEESCVTNSGYVYCIGGADGPGAPVNNTYYGLMTPAGVSSWSSSTNYPLAVELQSCVANSGYVYCIGGNTEPGFTSAVYFASLSSVGVGSWSRTTSYPTSIYNERCVVDSRFVYCIGGFAPGTVTNAVYFASLSSTGIGPWSPTTTYPTIITDQACVANQGFVYCIGGYRYSDGVTNAVYFAPLSSNGVGIWSSTTSYPNSYVINQACVADSARVYCFGGDAPNFHSSFSTPLTDVVNYAVLSSNGVGAWSQVSSYPIQIESQSCVVESGIAYCIGGEEWTAAGALLRTLSILQV